MQQSRFIEKLFLVLIATVILYIANLLIFQERSFSDGASSSGLRFVQLP